MTKHDDFAIVRAGDFPDEVRLDHRAVLAPAPDIHWMFYEQPDRRQTAGDFSANFYRRGHD